MRVAVILLLALTLFSAASAQYTVKFANIVHNYGAATPIVDYNQTALCGGDRNCGMVTSTGFSMMTAVGSYVRTRYNTESVVGATPFFSSETYNMFDVYSRSSDYPRTMQSSSAFLAGVFPAAPLYPVITLPNDTTSQMVTSTDTFPPVMMKKIVNQAGTEAALAATVSAALPHATLLLIAAEVDSAQYCADASKQLACVLRLHEIAQSREASNTLTSTPNLSSNLQAINDVYAAWAQYVYGYNATDADQQIQGSSGQIILSRLMANINGTIAGTNTYKVVEYSVDAGVLAPLAVTLGDQSASAVSPAYAESYLVELLQSTTNTSYYVRVIRGAPTLSGSAYAFTTKSFQLMCRSASNVDYAAADNTCPLADFQRYVQLTSRVDTQSYCDLPTEEKNLLGCPARPSQPMTQYCSTYRSTCPSYACPAGYVLNAANQRCARIASSASGIYKVVLPQVIHRHGARSPNFAFNQSFICGYEYPCGMLNDVGMEMLVAVGSYMRERYNDNVSIVETPLFPDGRYNASTMYTRSTGMARTIQSAAAFLSALFPSGSFYPVIFSVNMTTDLLLNTDPIPPVMLKSFNNPIGLEQTLDPVIDSLISWSDLHAAAVEAHVGGEGSNCYSFDTRAHCMLDLFDIGRSFQAVGRLGDDMPVLTSILPSLVVINIEYYRYLFAYDPSIELDREQGTMAQNLAQTLIANMRNHIAGPTYRMYEYSTHDTVVSPLGVTFGDQSDLTFDTQYATTWMVELLQDTGDDSYHVRVLRGRPMRNDTTSAFNFTQYEFVQRCMTSDGTVYIAGNNTCPLDDFARLVDSTAPAVENGYCIVNRTMYDNMNCPLTIEDNQPVGHYCQLYRIVCPTMSCPENYILASADLQCYPTDAAGTTTTTTSTTTTTTTTTAAPVNPAPASPRVAEQSDVAIHNQRVAVGVVNGINTGLAVGASVSLI